MKLAISYALSQSAKLSVYENKVVRLGIMGERHRGGVSIEACQCILSGPSIHPLQIGISIIQSTHLALALISLAGQHCFGDQEPPRILGGDRRGGHRGA